MYSVIRFGYSFLAIATLGGGGTIIALSTQSSSKNQESVSTQTVTPALPAHSTVTEASAPSFPQDTTQPVDVAHQPVLEVTEHRDLDLVPEIGNCEFITFAKTSNIPVAFNVTEEDYFSVICKKEGESTILPEKDWVGFFPKSFFSIDHEKINENSRVDIKVEDIQEEDPIYEQSDDDSLWYGIKISSPKIKGSESIDTKLTYYSENPSWAEVKSTSLDEKIYLLLTRSDEEEEA